MRCTKQLMPTFSTKVKTNQRIAETFGMRVHVPSAPNDAGLAVGGVLILHAPSRGTRQRMWSIGPRLWDEQDIPALIQRAVRSWSGPDRPLVARASVQRVAEMLATQAAVVAVARKRTEFGPRALGQLRAQLLDL